MSRRAPHNRPARTKGPLTVRRADGTVITVPNMHATRFAYSTLDVANSRIEHLEERRHR